MASEAVLNLLINLAGDAAEKARGLGEQIGGLGPIAVGAGLAVGGALLAGLGKGFDLATEARDGVNQLEAQLGLTRAEAEQLGDVAVDVFANNWGASLTDVQAAVGTVREQMKALSDDELQGVTEGALAIRDVFGTDVAETANAANVLMEKFSLTGKQATDFITAGFQRGLNTSGDFLESVTEYGVQFADSGASADQFFSILETGTQAGVLGTDKIADAMKESRIRIMEMSDDVLAGFETIGASAFENATGMRESFNAPGETLDWLKGKAAELGIEVDEELAGSVERGSLKAGKAFMTLLGGAIEDGSLTIADAQQEIIAGLQGVDNQLWQNSAGVKIFGTQWEDLGPSALLAVDMTKTAMEDLSGATDSLNVKYDNFSSLFGGAWRMIQAEVLLPIGETLLGLANEAMPLVQAATTALGDAIQWVKNNSDTVLPVLAGIGAAILVAIVPAFWSWAAGAMATGAANLAAMAPLLPVIAAVGLAVGLLYAAWQSNWGGIQEKTQAVSDYLSGTVWPWLVSAFNTVTATLLPPLQTAWTTVWGAVQTATTTAYTFFSTVVWPWLQGTAWPWIIDTALPALQTVWSTVWGGVQGATSTVYAFLKDTVWPWLRDSAWPWLKDTALPALQTAFSTAWGAIQLAISAVYTWWKDTFYPWLETTFNNFQEWMANLKISWETNVNIIKGIIDGMSQAMRTAKDDINTALDRVKEMLENGWDTVKSTVSSVWSTIGGYISGPIETAQGIVDRVIGQIKGVVQGGLDLVNSFIDAVNSIPGVPDLPNIPGRAMGGPVLAGSPYIVGEHGPELIVPQRNGYVYTADQTRGLLSGSAGSVTNHYSYTVHATYSRAQDERTIGDDLRRLTLMGSVS